MYPASIINFLSNEDTQELALGYLQYGETSIALSSGMENVVAVQ
jgi:hypothetical protein